MLSQILDTSYEMFEARGYTISKSTADEIYGKNGIKNIYLKILDNSKLNIEIIKYYYGYCIKNNIQHFIIVYHEVMTPSVKKVLQKMNITIEIFQKKELIYNKTKHILVPKHEKIDSEGQDLKSYPTIKKSDPICRFYFFQIGDLIKITRNDGSLFYRVVR